MADHKDVVADFSAVRSTGTPPGTDTRDAFHNAFLATEADQLPVFAPGGRYDFATSFTMQQESGNVFYGAGGGQIANTNFPTISSIGANTCLYWTGAASDQLIRCRSAGAHLRDFTIMNAHRGILMDYGAGTPSVGKNVFESIYFQDCTIGFQVGLTTAENNCDVCTYNNLHFRNCPTAIRFENGMGMAHVFEHPFLGGGDGNLFHVRGGGNILALHPTITSPNTRLWYFPSDLVNIGGSNANYQSIGGKVDESAGSTFKVVEMEAAAPCNIVVNGLHLASIAYQGAGAQTCIIRGSTSLKLKDCYKVVQGGTLQWHEVGGKYPSITIEGCKTQDIGLTPLAIHSALDVAGSTGMCYIRAVGNTKSEDGRAVPDWIGTYDATSGVFTRTEKLPFVGSI